MKKFIPFLAFWFFFACSQQQEKTVPESLISEDTLVSVLADLHVAQAAASSKNLPADSAKKVYTKKEHRIYERYNLTEKGFNESYRYYLKDVKKMDEIYSRVVDTLSIMEARVQKGN